MTRPEIHPSLKSKSREPNNGEISHFIHCLTLVTLGKMLSINWPFLWGRVGLRSELGKTFFQTFTLIFMCMFLTANTTRKNFNRISFLLPSCLDNIFNISGKAHKISCMHAMFSLPFLALPRLVFLSSCFQLLPHLNSLATKSETLTRRKAENLLSL